MNAPPKSKYKALHGAVRSFSEGITGIICSGFQELARHTAKRGHYQCYTDHLFHTVVSYASVTVLPRPRLKLFLNTLNSPSPVPDFVRPYWASASAITVSS